MFEKALESEEIELEEVSYVYMYMYIIHVCVHHMITYVRVYCRAEMNTLLSGYLSAN